AEMPPAYGFNSGALCGWAPTLGSPGGERRADPIGEAASPARSARGQEEDDPDRQPNRYRKHEQRRHDDGKAQRDRRGDAEALQRHAPVFAVELGYRLGALAFVA